MLRDAPPATVRVEAGEEQGLLVFSLVHSESYTIRGTLFESSGEPAGGVNVRLSAVDDVRDLMAVSVIRTSSDGQFEITNVPHGTHAIVVQRYATFGRGVEWAWMPLTVTGNIDDINVRLTPAVGVQGRVIFEGKGTTPPQLFV